MILGLFINHYFLIFPCFLTASPAKPLLKIFITSEIFLALVCTKYGLERKKRGQGGGSVSLKKELLRMLFLIFEIFESISLIKSLDFFLFLHLFFCLPLPVDNFTKKALWTEIRNHILVSDAKKQHFTCG